LRNHKGVIDKLKKNNIINDHQYKLIYPVTQATSSKEFDSSLLHLLNRNFGGFKCPRTGWDQEPDQADHSIIANLIRLKIGRNMISHLTFSGTTKKFYREIYKKVKIPLLNLHCTPKDLQSVEPAAIRFKLVPAVPDFCGREKEIANLHQDILRAKRTHGIIGVVVSALSGTGKTELVKKYFEDNQAHFNYNIAWINAASMEESFRQLAQFIQIPLKDNNGDEKEIDTLITQVHDYFLDMKVLFVFDNYEHSQSKDLENDLIRFIPKEPNSCSIITSQVEIAHHGLIRYKLNSLSMDHCMALFEISLGEKQDQASLRDILEFFGCNALALQQLIVYIKETNCTVKDYWQLVKEDPDFLTCTNKVYTAVSLTIHRLANESEKAYMLLQQMAFLDNTELKRGFFVCGQVFKKQDNCMNNRMLDEANKGLFVLERYSLVSIQEGEEKDKFSDIISVHSIVQSAMMKILLQKNKARTLFKMLLSYIFGDEIVNEDNLRFEDFRFFKYCYRQLIYIHRNMPDFKEDFILICKDRICDLATIFCNQGAYKFVISFLEEIKGNDFFLKDA